MEQKRGRQRHKLSGILVRNPAATWPSYGMSGTQAQRAVAKGSAFVTACSPSGPPPSASVSASYFFKHASPAGRTSHPGPYLDTTSIPMERRTGQPNSSYAILPKTESPSPKKIVVRFSEGEWSLLSLPPRSFSMISHRLARL